MLVISFAVSVAKGEGREAGRESKGLGFFVTSRADPSSQYAATTTRDRHRISVRKMERSYQEEARGVEIINGHETVFSARISSSSSAWYKMDSL
jgi:hypothetical protein